MILAAILATLAALVVALVALGLGLAAYRQRCQARAWERWWWDGDQGPDGDVFVAWTEDPDG